MKTAMTFGWILAGLILMGGVASADNPWKEYKKHMKRYYNHMEEAYEEASEGDWEDYNEEMAKAQANYNAAQYSKPRPPVVVVPAPTRRSSPVVIYRPSH